MKTKAKQLRELAYFINDARILGVIIDWPSNPRLWRFLFIRGFERKHVAWPRHYQSVRLHELAKQHYREALAKQQKIEARMAEIKVEVQAEIDAGKYTIYGDWIVHQVDECTCGVGPLGTMHERDCGIHPVVKLIDVVLPTSEELRS